eukprot:TRINITY_DN9361_c0_g4_i1.p1 TRINITY_DN9361_c0_g4~~TRINITY_DN9361_c0_g4_i1.p1  ORF type:complete len:149 (-),score=41.29 TRINITY_DN9361_c0_g4_i1:176-622(-)
MQANSKCKNFSSNCLPSSDHSYHSPTNAITTDATSPFTHSPVAAAKTKGVKKKGFSQILNPFMEEENDEARRFEELMARESDVKLGTRPEYAKDREKYVGSPDPALVRLGIRRMKTWIDIDRKQNRMINKLCSGKLDADNKLVKLGKE